MSNPNDDLLKNLQDGFSDFGKRVGNFVDEVLSSETFSSTAGGGEVRVAHDAYQLGDEFIVELELPGLQKQEIQVQILEDLLQVKGEKKPANDTGKAQFNKRERSYGSFLKSIPLPEGVDKNNSKAKYDLGVLTIRFPNPQGNKPEPEDDGTSVDID